MLKRQTQRCNLSLTAVAVFILAQCLGCGSPLDHLPTPERTGESESDLASPETASSEPLYSPEAFRDAALEGKLRVVEICVESGMDIDEADPNGFTALAMAAYNGHDEILELLIKNKATIDARDRQGNTPLIHAASGPYPTTVKLLLAAGAEIDAVDAGINGGEHFTALMMAAAMGNIEVVKVLLAAGANKEMLDDDGESAIDFARSKGHPKIAELLAAE